MTSSTEKCSRSWCKLKCQKGKKQCPLHLRQSREGVRRRSADRVAKGQCVNCHRQAIPGNQRCDLHRQINIKRSKEWGQDNRQRKAEYDRETSLAWIRAGLCPDCSEHLPLDGRFRRCTECRKGHSKKRKKIVGPLPARGDKDDKRCGLVGQKDIECTELGPELEDWCHGCELYICEAHSRNFSMPFGKHDPMEHLDFDGEDGDDDGEPEEDSSALDL